MITTPTTFVVGAGASNDYGLPTSVKLRKEAHNLNPQHTAYQLILRANLCTPEQLNKILDDLRSQGTRSIDEFLFARQDDAVTMKVGRALIALLLGSHFTRASSPDALGAGPPDWLGYIIGKMHSGAPNCEAFVRGNAEVRFVTFNFDSIIEDRLEKALLNLYRGAAEAHLRDTVRAIHGQIIHVHGRLTPPPGPLLPLRDSDGQIIHVHGRLTLPPGPLLPLRDSDGWVDWLSSAPSEIRVVLDQIEHSTLVATQGAVRRSAILCFLGFAYASDNLTRLDFPKAIDRGVDGEIVLRHIFGTAVGMRRGETAWVTDKLGNRAVLGDESEGCFDFLRNHHIFRD